MLSTQNEEVKMISLIKNIENYIKLTDDECELIRNLFTAKSVKKGETTKETFANLYPLFQKDC